jgi:hypothetical protein
MFQIEPRQVLFDWLAQERNPDRRQAVLDWFAGLVEEPAGQAHRVPGVRASVYLAVIPCRPPLAVTFLIATEFRTVKLISLEDLA